MKNSLLYSCLVFLNFFALTQEDHSLPELDSMAYDFLMSEQNDSAEKVAHEIIALSDGEPIYRINALTLLGILNKNKGYYATAAEYYFQALMVAEKIKDTARLSMCYNNIGTIYQYQKNYDQAIDYFKRSLLIETDLGNDEQKSIRYFNIGDAYLKIDSLTLALNFFNNSLILEERMGNNAGLIYAYLGIAEVYLRMNDALQAKLILDIVENKISGSMKELTILANKLWAQYYLLIRDFQNADLYADKAMNISRKNDLVIYDIELLQIMIDANLQLNNLKRLKELYPELISAKDSYMTTLIQNKVEDLAYNYKIQAKEMEVSMLKEEREILERTTVIQNNIAKLQQRIVFFLLTTLFVLSLLIFLRFKKSRPNG
jgi:tetratricopeptide (TPR) repeat protein